MAPVTFGERPCECHIVGHYYGATSVCAMFRCPRPHKLAGVCMIDNSANRISAGQITVTFIFILILALFHRPPFEKGTIDGGFAFCRACTSSPLIALLIHLEGRCWKRRKRRQSRKETERDETRQKLKITCRISTNFCA